MDFNRKRILIVEDDPELRQILRWFLERHGLEVVDCQSTSEAKIHLTDSKIDLVISDYSLQGESSTELLHWLRDSIHFPPFILMSGHSKDSEEMRRAIDLGAVTTLTKPFQQSEVIQAVAVALPEARAKETSHPREYCQIPVDCFLSGQDIPFSIYLHLSEGKCLKIAHQGSDLDSARLHSFRESGVRHLYITQEDYARFIGFNLEKCRASLNATITRAG